MSFPSSHNPISNLYLDIPVDLRMDSGPNQFICSNQSYSSDCLTIEFINLFYEYLITKLKSQESITLVLSLESRLWTGTIEIEFGTAFFWNYSPMIEILNLTMTLSNSQASCLDIVKIHRFFKTKENGSLKIVSPSNSNGEAWNSKLIKYRSGFALFAQRIHFNPDNGPTALIRLDFEKDLVELSMADISSKSSFPYNGTAMVRSFLIKS